MGRVELLLLLLQDLSPCLTGNAHLVNTGILMRKASHKLYVLNRFNDIITAPNLKYFGMGEKATIEQVTSRAPRARKSAEGTRKEMILKWGGG